MWLCRVGSLEERDAAKVGKVPVCLRSWTVCLRKNIRNTRSTGIEHESVASIGTNAEGLSDNVAPDE